MKKKLIFSFIIILVILIIILCIDMNKNNNIVTENNTNTKNIDKVEELKNDIGATGDINIYEVKKDAYDDMEVLTVKTSVKYKVAFAGIIKQDIPTMDEIDEIFNNNYPVKKGIWIEKDSREVILKILNDNDFFNCKYMIDKDGYIVIDEENELNENDAKIKHALDSEKQYIICISSVCYIVDDITGEILDYSFENMDRYQTYEYFEDDNKKIIFVTENKTNQLTKKEIIDSVLALIQN